MISLKKSTKKKAPELRHIFLEALYKIKLNSDLPYLKLIYDTQYIFLVIIIYNHLNKKLKYF
jgi:hypothetical protein